MIRNFALTFAAVTLRLWLPLFAVLGIHFEMGFLVIVWISCHFECLGGGVVATTARVLTTGGTIRHAAVAAS